MHSINNISFELKSSMVNKTAEFQNKFFYKNEYVGKQMQFIQALLHAALHLRQYAYLLDIGLIYNLEV